MGPAAWLETGGAALATDGWVTGLALHGSGSGPDQTTPQRLTPLQDDDISSSL
jgi:hypothetical protein